MPSSLCNMPPCWVRSTAACASCRCGSERRSTTRPKSTPCSRPAAANCSNVSANSTAPARWGCGSRGKAPARWRPTRPPKPRRRLVTWSDAAPAISGRMPRRSLIARWCDDSGSGYKACIGIGEDCRPLRRLIRLAFLVERDRVAAFRHGVADASRDGGPGQCAVLGPWPPYSFV